MRKLLLIISLCVSQLAISQVYTVSGNLRDQDGNAIVNALVSVISVQDTTRSIAAVCDADGNFCQTLPQGDYMLAAEYMGDRYRLSGSTFNVADHDVTLPSFTITLRSHEMNELTVVSRKPFVSYKGGDATYYLDANPMTAGRNLLEGLTLIPGLQLSGDKSVTFLGLYQITVFVDKRKLQLSNEQVLSYLSTLGVNDVEAVELIRHPGPEYGIPDGAVLNIRTKRHAGEGLSGTASTELTYRTYVSEAARGRINLNKGKAKSYISYSFEEERDKETLWTTLGSDTTRTYPYREHDFQAGTELSLSPNHYIGAQGYLSLVSSRKDNRPLGGEDMRRNNESLTLYHSLSGNNWSWKNDLSYTAGHTRRSYPDNPTQNPDKTKEHARGFHFSTDAHHALGPAFGIDLGGDFDFGQTRTTAYGTNTSEDKYRESDLSAYLTVLYNNGSLDASAGIRVEGEWGRNSWENGATVLKRKQWHALPYFTLSYDFTPKNNLTLGLQSNYHRPSFRDLMPLATSSSSFLSRRGNPDLKSGTQHILSLTYTYMRAATVELDFSDERSPITEYIEPVNGRYFLTKANLDRSRYLRVVIGAPIPVVYHKDGMQWFITDYAAYHLQHDKGTVNTQDYRHTFHAWYFMHQQTLHLPGNWNLEGKVTYYSPLFSGVYKTEKQWWIDFNVGKQVGNWLFSLSGKDLFNTNVAKGQIEGLPLPAAFEKNWHSPEITLGVTLTFGKRHLKTYDRKPTGIDKRINSTADEGISIGSK